MSTNLALAQLDDARDDVLADLGPRRSPIEIVTSRTQRLARPRLAYALIATAALFVLLLTQLGLSIALSRGAYQISSLQSQQTALSLTQQKYSEKLGVLSSPQNIANNATALGMVRNQNPVYLDLSTERVYGTPTPAASDAATSANLIDNSLLKGIPVVTQSKAEKAKAAAAAKAKAAATAKAPKSAAAGAASQTTTSDSVPSSANELAAPETR
jgi:hypothetical protein